MSINNTRVVNKELSPYTVNPKPQPLIPIPEITEQAKTSQQSYQQSAQQQA